MSQSNPLELNRKHVPVVRVGHSSVVKPSTPGRLTLLWRTARGFTNPLGEGGLAGVAHDNALV